jgi:hypothetical protein
MKTVEDVRAFFWELIDKYSLNFHPDTPFEDFDVLTNVQATALNKKMDKAFKVCEKEKVDIYGIGLEIHRQALEQIRLEVQNQMHNHGATPEPN